MTRPKYSINVFWSADDDCWIADIPDMKCCSAHGDTPVEALIEVQIAMHGWLKVAQDMDMPLPEPDYQPTSGAAKFLT